MLNSHCYVLVLERVRVVCIEAYAWRFREKHWSKENYESESNLESDWKAPGKLIRSKRAAIVGPVSNEGTKRDDTAFYTDQ